ncbi:unnamed protein product [Ectocarpus sp. CCAP 1310/34]|nr:unnamed protein product [Ectocarpus sp. CCAP 1310/34]
MLSPPPRTTRTGCLPFVSKLSGRSLVGILPKALCEVDVSTKEGLFRASVPSGASTGVHEAVELRDGGSLYMGKGVSKAVENVNKPLSRVGHIIRHGSAIIYHKGRWNKTIGPALIGLDATDQEGIDAKMIELDGTPNKGNLGANAILGASLAVSKAGAGSKAVPLYQHYADLAGNSDLVLPVPSFNVINGGEHAGNKLAFQEFMILPTGAETFTEAMSIGCEVYHELKSVIKGKYGQDACNVGDEGGFAPNIQSNLEGIELLMAAIKKAGYEDKVVVGMDVASSEFLMPDGRYDLDFKNKGGDQQLTGEELGQLYKDLAAKYPIVSIEDPFDQDDWANYAPFTAAVGDAVQVVGDDLLVTNPSRITEAGEKKACNALLLKGLPRRCTCASVYSGENTRGRDATFPWPSDALCVTSATEGRDSDAPPVDRGY